ncbi:hypothetical protein J4E85_011262 [Alternaria conjuncta]|uniref:uncharacterized protein n=1 Tax=Alternaria conjuncta TaxID=181017 RepID=UPI002220629B|nr:uncharacterized protein J4E85_011262 [Alternaria conjuncta]KAI4911353.1 hypothetical protein J4E85_011262 [Alternaria conjuncta]
MSEVTGKPHSKGSDNSATPANTSSAVPQPAAPPEPPRRQQMRSCDSCKRGKRACDADKRVDFANQTCSNCLRKNQVCTFNWLKTASVTHPERERKRRRSEEKSDSDQLEQHAASSSVSYQYQIPPGSIANEAQYELQDRGTQWSSSQDEDETREDYFNDPPSDDVDNISDESIHSLDLDSVQLGRNNEQGLLQPRYSRRSSFALRPHRRNQRDDASSPFMDILLGERTSRGFVTNGLLRIYNDSMENSLSCWLTEHNCPYTMTRYKPSLLSASKATREWSGTWSNRMYNRVLQLDRAYASLRIRKPTTDEERTISKALNMVIMSFASQWAQAGERGAGGRATDHQFTADRFPQSNEFERSMQETLWHQTAKLLHQAADIGSFRVIFALIIFSLTQRPLDTTQLHTRTDPKLRTHYEHFQALVQDDDAPIFLEIALRQLLAQRRRLERVEQDLGRDPLQQEDRDTFNLLYWFGVMFDTLSAAISQRPVVVDDEDSELPPPTNDAYTEQFTWSNPPTTYTDQFGMRTNPSILSTEPTATQAQEGNAVWGDLFTRNGTLEVDPGAARWPCSYKVAAATLSSAAPVKVLLYRRVAHLQALVSRKVSPARIESGINGAFHVYNHWHRTYAPFFSDCVKHHATLPTRVQSWYTLIAGHWHLATFLLSDLLLTIDKTKLSSPNERTLRQSSNLVDTLRRQNALAVADLSLASIHSVKEKEGTDEFHFALSQAALLTEPWTVAFVRSLCRAGYVLVQVVASETIEEEREQAIRRCRDCIEGLWYLGRKSDMAFLAARYLSDMLDEAIRDTSARMMAEEMGSDSATVSSQFGTSSSPGTDAGVPVYQQPFGSIGAFPSWTDADLMGSCQPGTKIDEGDVLNMETPLNVDSALLWDFSLQG